MAEVETGIKWWMRYVIVPIIGGGGIVTLVVALMNRPPNPQPQQSTDQKKTAPQPQPKSTDNGKNKSKGGAETPKGGTPKPEKPAAPGPFAQPVNHQYTPALVNGANPASPTAELTLYETQSNKELKGNVLSLRPGGRYYVAWKVDPASVKGLLYLQFRIEPYTIAKPATHQVKNSGKQDFVCKDPGPINHYVYSLLVKHQGDMANHYLASVKFSCHAAK